MPRAGLTPHRLALAAAEIADERGLEHVTVTELARHFGVRPASLYSHVASTQALRTSVTLVALEELADRAAAGLAGRAGRDALRALADSYRDYGREHPGRYAATRLPLEPEVAATSAGPRHAAMSRAVLRGYDLDEPDATHAVRLLGSVFHGFTTLELGGGFRHSAPDSQESWERVVDGLDVLLRAWPTTTTPRATPESDPR